MLNSCSVSCDPSVVVASSWEMMSSVGECGRMRLLSVCPEDRLRSILGYLFDEEEFLSPYGLRSLSKAHEAEPFTVEFEGGVHSVGYSPGESDSPMFGGNSNWLGLP